MRTGLPWGSPASSTRRTRPSEHLISRSITWSSLVARLESPPFECEADAEDDQNASRQALQSQARTLTHTAPFGPADHISVEVQPNQQDGFVRGHHQYQSQRRIRRAHELRQRRRKDRARFGVEQVIDQSLPQGDSVSHRVKCLARLERGILLAPTQGPSDGADTQI